MGLALLLAVFFAARHLGLSEASRAQSRAASGRERKVVAIDAGHGGNDPGKVGVNDSLEKDINLAVAERLKRYLEQSDVQVVMTREEDKGLYRDRDQRKKMADMKKRCQVINEAEPDAVVSIHQNSYPQEDVSGGQVFYYRDSEEGRRLAERIQERFSLLSGGENGRQAKSNDSYYLLLHVESPVVIVECGFLSNWAEARRLADEEYQDRLAWTIHMGIMEYLNGAGARAAEITEKGETS